MVIFTAVAAAVRYGNVLDYTGPNLASNQAVLYAPLPGGTQLFGPNGSSTAPTPPSIALQDKLVDRIAEALGANFGNRTRADGRRPAARGGGAERNGQIYVATSQLLKALGIKSSTIDPNVDILTMRPGLSGISLMQLTWSPPQKGQILNGSNSSSNPYACPKTSCLWNPVIQEIGALPSGTSAPNTLITEHAIHALGLQTSLAGWFIRAVHPPTAAQIRNARLLASTVSGMSLETKNSLPSGMEVTDLATLFGILLAFLRSSR